MSAALHLGGPEDLEPLDAMVTGFHHEMGIATDAGTRRGALELLLAGSPHGAAWLIGPRRAPIGYVVVSFGFSVEMGGIDGWIDEFCLRPNVRGRGIGTEVLTALVPTLARHGVRALHLELAEGDDRAMRLYRRAGFEIRQGYRMMTCALTDLS